MNKNHLYRFVSCSLFLAGATLCLSAKDAELKKPTLTLDPSPVSQGAKPGMVTSYADVIEPVQKAVVSVHSTKIVRSQIQVHPMFRQFFGEAPEKESKQQGLGSGVIISPDGYILTNNHVIEGADELKVALSDGREMIAKLIGADPKTDVAVIKIDGEKLPVVPLADSDKIRVGDVVFALGNPLGVGQTVTMGIVSAVGRNNLGLLSENGTELGYESFIQTDAAINMGNSGGALVDAKGRLVGINTAIISPSRGNIGIGFAIPVNLAAATMNNLIANDGVVQRGLLGVSGINVNDDPALAETLGIKKGQQGVLVQQLQPADGPAAKAGIKREDVIISINDKPITSINELRLSVAQMTPGTVVKVTFLREGKEQSVNVTLGRLDASSGNELLPGITVAPLSSEVRKQLDIDRNIEGLVVQDVSEKSPYLERLVPGLVIIEVNRQPVKTVEEARQNLKKGGNNLLYVYYRGVFRYIVLPVR